MSDAQMTAEKATALRKPFPKQSVGILPKPYKKDSPKGQCGECGGYHGLPAVHLDFVGHAAVTDRLLTVDPHWTWDFAEVDPATGLPSLRHSIDPDHNLWIRLTICGVTRIGVGDGSSMKERIGDAIRNAAMRFGVALDLWAKENLVEFAQAARQPADPIDGMGSRVTPPPAAPPASPVNHDAQPSYDPGSGQPMLPPDAPMEEKTRKQMFAELGKVTKDEDEQRRGIGNIIGREITSRKDLTEAEGRQVIDKLKQRRAHAAQQKASA